MRISDWSSDVCSSDLAEPHVAVHLRILAARDVVTVAVLGLFHHLDGERVAAQPRFLARDERLERSLAAGSSRQLSGLLRSEERRVGKECVSTCRSRWSPDPSKKNNNK